MVESVAISGENAYDNFVFNLNTFYISYFSDNYYSNLRRPLNDAEAASLLGTSVSSGYADDPYNSTPVDTIGGTGLVIDGWVKDRSDFYYLAAHLSLEYANITTFTTQANHNSAGQTIFVDFIEDAISSPDIYAGVSYSGLKSDGAFFQNVGARIYGVYGDDSLTGGEYDDWISGSSGADALSGRGGNDQLYAGYDLSPDTLSGGDGTDAFAVTATDSRSTTDTITDLQSGETITIRLNGASPNFEPSQVPNGDGKDLLANQIEISAGETESIIWIGRDSVPGADAQLILEGDYRDRIFSASGSVVSLSDGATVSITAGPAVAEGSNGLGNHLEFTVSRTGDLSKSLKVYYEFTKTFVDRFGQTQLKNHLDVEDALSPDLVKSITIPAGQSSAIISLTAFGDNIPEQDASVELRLTPASAYSISKESGTATGTIFDDDGAGGLTSTIGGLFVGIINDHFKGHFDRFDPTTQETAFLEEAWDLTLSLRDVSPLDENLRDADYYLQSLVFLERTPALFRIPFAITFAPIAELYDLLKAIGQVDLAAALAGKDNPNNPNTGPGGASFAEQGLIDYFSGHWRDYLPGGTPSPLRSPLSTSVFEAAQTEFYVRAVGAGLTEDRYTFGTTVMIPVDTFPTDLADGATFFDFSGGTMSLGAAAEILIIAADQGVYDLGGGDDVVSVVSGSHIISGAVGNDILMMGEHNDTAEGGHGDDHLLGGEGIDTAVFSGMRVNYLITRGEDLAVSVRDLRDGSPDGVDVIQAFEFFQFSDGIVSLDNALRPGVTINQAAGQSDPDTDGSIVFDVVFSEAVTGFTNADVVLSGTAPGTTTALVSGSGSNYTVTVTGMTGPGTVIAAIAAGAASDGAGNLSLASTSIDNTVTYAPEPIDTTPPTVTIDQAASQPDPDADGSVAFNVVFREAVTGFTSADVVLSGTAPGTTTALVSGSGSNYTVTVTGMTGPGTVIAAIAAGAASDGAGNLSLASTSIDNTVTYAPAPSSGIISGTKHGDFLRGTNASETFLPLQGVDTVKAGGGNDIILASKYDGLDFYHGDAGSDTVDYSALTQGVNVHLGTLFGTGIGGAIGKQSGIDTLTSIENIIGSRAGDTIKGNGLANILDAGMGNDSLTGGGASDFFVFGPDFGNDRISDFDARPAGGQDYIDLRGLGFTSSDFAEVVEILDLGASTKVIVDGAGSILLAGVSGTGSNVIDESDFLLL
jgi:Ca2+-binding RTX toxin-like protein